MNWNLSNICLGAIAVLAALGWADVGRSQTNPNRPNTDYRNPSIAIPRRVPVPVPGSNTIRIITGDGDSFLVPNTYTIQVRQRGDRRVFPDRTYVYPYSRYGYPYTPYTVFPDVRVVPQSRQIYQPYAPTYPLPSYCDTVVTSGNSGITISIRQPCR